MTLTAATAEADNLPELEEGDMVKAVPSKKLFAKGIPVDGKWQAMFSLPGFVPDVHRQPDGKPYEFGTEQEAEIAGMYAAFAIFNAPRVRLEGSRKTGGRPGRLTGPEFSQMLRIAGVDPSLFAFIFGTSTNRVFEWMDGREDIPHPVRILLDIFINYPAAIEAAERLTESVIIPKK